MSGVSQSTLERWLERYTNFKIEFMNEDGTKTRRYLDIPYYQTIGSAYGGKNSPSEIEAYILSANENWDGDTLKSSSVLQDFVDDKDNLVETGIDCSGLVYYCVNEASYNDLVKKQFNNTSYGNGVSASSLSSSSNGTKITQAKDMVPGCTMRMDSGGHVAVIYEVVKDSSGTVTKIRYAHSNPSKGPHKAYIKIGDEDQDLDGSSQTWYDSAYSNSTAKGYYNYTILLKSLE